MRRVKFDNLKSQFKDYLIDHGLSEFTASGHKSTTYDYTQRIERICKDEDITWLELTKKIDEFVVKYDTKGSKELEGLKSNRAPINALKKFSEFCDKFCLKPVKFGDQLLIVDLFSGAYNDDNYGHELFNEKPNPFNGYYYGYVPDYDNPNIDKLGASKSNLYVDGVLVVFVTKISEKNKNRIVTGFYPSARVYRKGESNEIPNRTFIDKDRSEKKSSYSLFSKSYISVDINESLVIDISKYSNHMFRKQRVYQGTYPDLDKRIFDFINNHTFEDKEDDVDYQRLIEKSEGLSDDKTLDARNRELELQSSVSSNIIKRDPRIAKTAIISSGFKCEVNGSHITFQKYNGEQYMEGHHLIPCTYNNAIDFKEKHNINIDCVENIVSVCPNCHRAIHYGDEKTKTAILEVLFNLKQNTFEALNINLNFDEIKRYYF